MRYRKFGRTGLFVSEICLGTMTFGGRDGLWGKIGNLQQTDADRLIEYALDEGVNFIDTADVYADGLSEIMTGQALRNLRVPRENVVIASKVYGDTGTKGVNSRGLSRYHIMNGLKASLMRLQLDHIDLYQVHAFDPATPIEETLGALDDLVRQGYVRYTGVSNWAAWQLMKSLGLSDRLRLTRFASLQAHYTIIGRDIERELIPLVQSEELALLVWSPLAGGLLSGKYGRDIEPEDGSRRTQSDFPPVNIERAYDCIDTMREMAEAREVSVAQIALAWLLQQNAVTSVIVGAKRIEQLRDNIAATRVKLTEEECSALSTLSALPSEYPGWMIERQGASRRAQEQ